MGVRISNRASGEQRPALHPRGMGAGAAAYYSRTVPLLQGDDGTAQTIDLIRETIAQGLQDAKVRATLAAILQPVQAYDTVGEARAIFDWIVSNIRFTSHPVATQLVQSARYTIENRIGNCTDINAVLIATLLMSAGIPVRLVTVANDPNDPEGFSHVYCEAWLQGRWTPVDAAIPHPQFGKTLNRVYRKRVWSLVDENAMEMPTLQGAVMRLGQDGTDITAADLQASATPGDFIGPGDPGFIGPTLPFFPTPTGSGVVVDGVAYATPSDVPGSTANWLNSILSVANSVQRSLGLNVAAPGALPPGAIAPSSTSGFPVGTILLVGGGLLAFSAIAGRKR